MCEDNKPTILPLTIFQIGTLYSRIYRGGAQLFREKAFPLEMDQIPVVMKLHYGGSASQQEICSNLQRDKASVNRTVSFLLKKDIVSVVQDTIDKRKTLVELTASGKKLAKQAEVILEEFDGELSSVLTKKEKEQFHSLMLKLIGAANFT